MNPLAIFESMQAARASLAGIGALYQMVLVAAAAVVALFAIMPAWRRWRGVVLACMAALLVVGELLLVRFHMQLYDLAVVVDPATGATTGRVAVPLWVESEKLFVWALCVAVLGALMRRQREDLLPGVMLVTAALAAGAALLGRPFTEPLPGFFGQYYGYLQASAQGGRQRSVRSRAWRALGSSTTTRGTCGCTRRCSSSATDASRSPSSPRCR